jgi:glycosyltransferase involved in cell wall biosynthesis
MQKKKVLAWCDSPAVSTGFGVVSKNIFKKLYATGRYEIDIVGINHFGYYDQKEHPYRIFPASLNQEGDLLGRSVFKEKVKFGNYDIIFMFQDHFHVAPLLHDIRQGLKEGVKVVTYFPIDSYFRKEWGPVIFDADEAVVYNNWSYLDVLSIFPTAKQKLRVIEHGIDPKVYFPIEDKEEILQFKKEYFKVAEDTFLITNVNMNQPRKDLARNIIAYREIEKKIPNSRLYLHCNITERALNLYNLVEQLGLKKSVTVPKSPVPEDVLNLIYNASDVVVTTTLGEGCGLSSYEAMATKTPFVGPKNTAFSESLVDGRGFLVRCGHDFVVLANDNQTLRPLTDMHDFINQVLLVHNNKELVNQTVERAYTWIQDRTWDKVCTGWVKLFDTLGEESGESDGKDSGDSLVLEKGQSKNKDS